MSASTKTKKSIESLFDTKIHRRIEEVVKVQQHAVEVVREEITEYVPTEAIQRAYEKVLQALIESLGDPSEAIGVWVSGFFGSGKSSFAKILGYVLEDRAVGKEKASSLLKRRLPDNKKLRDLVELVNRRLPVTAVIFDISECLFVRTQNEPVREVMYRAFLNTLGYSDDIDVAELEVDLEKRGLLDDFSRRYKKRFKRPWEDGRRDRSFALSEASAILHDMEPDTYPSADSWFRGRKPVNLETEQFVERCFELMDRRRPGRALVFVVDEVGQYVSRSVDKMLDLQGVVQAFGRVGRNRAKSKAGHQGWVIVTAQEKLDEVVDALGARKTELARLQARFQTEIDLVPADISEVASRRVLRKSAAGEKALREIFKKNSGRIRELSSWSRTSRRTEITEDAFVRLYPFPPHFIELSIDIVTGIRLLPGAMRHIGGSNRTIIKQAQQVLIHPEVALSKRPVGELVTLDMLFDLLRPSIPSERWRDIHEIEERIAAKAPLAPRVAKAVTLMEFVRDLPRTAENIAAVLWGRVEGDSVKPGVERALKDLQRHQFVRFDAEEGGFKLQDAQEKSWAKERGAVELKGKQRLELLREKLREVFGEPGLRTCRLGGLRTLKIGYSLERDKLGEEGDVSVNLLVGDDEQGIEQAARRARGRSDKDADPNRLYWVLGLNERQNWLLEDLFRCREMIARREQQQAQGALPKDEVKLLTEEKLLRDRRERELRNALAAAARTGKGYFRGVECDLTNRGENLSEAGQAFVSQCLPELFPKFQMAARSVSGKEAAEILAAADLSGLSALFYDGKTGLSLVVRRGEKWAVNAAAETAREVLSFLKDRHAYGERVDGRSLENRFSGIGYGWDPDLLKAVVASLLRGSAIEVVMEGRRVRRYDEPSLKEVFRKVSAWRKAAFAPRETLDLKMLADAARSLESITGEEAEVEEDAIARRARSMVKTELEVISPAIAGVRALELPGEESMAELERELRGLLGASAEDCVKTLAEAGRTLAQSLRRGRSIAKVLSGDGLSVLKDARAAVGQAKALVERGTFDAEAQESFDRLRESLSAESFSDRLREIAEDARLVREAYRRRYAERHERRLSLYDKAIEAVKSGPAWTALIRVLTGQAERRGIPKGEIGGAVAKEADAVLGPLTARACPAQVKETPPCPNCSATVAALDQDIEMAGAFADRVSTRVVELGEPPEEVERVRVSEFIPPNALDSVEAVEEAVERLREHLVRLVKEGRRFRLE